MSDHKKQQRDSQQLYAAILGKILSGEFAPGYWLVEDELARTYNTSRTPIREVLMGLARDGLVERLRNRGARVVAVTPDDVEEIYDIRQALECLSIRGAVRKLRLTDLLEFERRLEELNRGGGARWQEKQAEIDLQLHQLIISHSGNRRLIAFLENISVLIHSLRLLGYRDDQRARRGGEEHLGIVRALLRRDAELAERLMAEHMETGKKFALESYFRREADREKPPVSSGHLKPAISQSLDGELAIRLKPLKPAQFGGPE
jgi:DNA-binding GntR family transcriptional regulator